MTFLLVHSLNRRSSSSSSSDYVLDLKNYLNGSTVKLKQINIPDTVYNIRQGFNDRVVWRRSSTDFSYQVSPGKWTISDLISTIQAGMNAGDANSYVVSYSSTTFEVTISGSAAFVLNWSTNSNASTSMWRELGFTQADTSSATSQTGSNAVQLNYPMNFLVRIQEFGIGGVTDRGFWYTFQGSFNVGSGELQESTEGHYFPQQVAVTSKTQIGSLTVQLFYQDGTSLSLNGADWTFTLEVD